MELKIELMEAWKWRETEDCYSLNHFDSSTTPFRIMHTLVWNYRGVMKPFFSKIVMDLVEWHSPLLIVITKTRLSGARAEVIIERLPFDGVVVADMIGFARGIWLLWRSDLVQVDVLASTVQEIHTLIRVRSQTFSWLLSAIYASLRFLERCILWDNLKMLASLHNLPWDLIGDFNELLTEEEKSRGNSISQRRVVAIRDCMNVCHMLDLGFFGPKFTWSSKREFGNLIQCRLDRCWANPDWKEFFNKANVTHLARINLDHCPLLLNLCPNIGATSSRPFRFQSVWLSHMEFPIMVREAWLGQDDNLVRAISGFTLKAQKWNKKVFGNVFTKKR